jgi:transposase
MNDHMQPPEFAAYIGVDWGDEFHCLSLRVANTQSVERYKLEHRPEVLAHWFSALQQRFPGQRIAVALEQSRGSLIYALMSYQFLVLYPVNPKTLAKFREAFYVSGAKDDPLDSDLVLELLSLHRDKLRAWEPDDELTRTLDLLVQHRRTLVATQTRFTNQLRDLLKLYFPQALDWAGELATVQACDFLKRWPTLAKLQQSAASKVQKFYLAHGCRKTAVIEARLEQMPLAQPLTTDGAVITASVSLVQALVDQLRPLLASIKQLEKQIADLFAQHDDAAIFTSLPGAGASLAPRLLVAFGTNRARFSSAQEMQQWSGIAPVIERSGKSCWVHRRFACPKFLRQSFHEFAAQSVRWSPWAAAFYHQQRQRGAAHHAAVRSLAFKWIRIIYRCWQTRVPYSEEYFQQTLHRRGSALAKQLPLAAAC